MENNIIIWQNSEPKPSTPITFESGLIGTVIIIVLIFIIYKVSGE